MYNLIGYSVVDDEWDKILDLLKEVVKDKDKKIIFFVDLVYIDFVGDDDVCRKFFKKFFNLFENVFVLVGFSMLKGFIVYGMRMGVIICIFLSEDVVEEFYYLCVYLCRVNWLNCNRSVMVVLFNIVNDFKKFKEYEDEKEIYKNMFIRRVDVFVKEVERVGLEIFLYIVGFFVSILCDNLKEVCEELIKYNLFVVLLKMGLRFVVCVVFEDKCKKVLSIIKEVFESLEVKINN